MMRPKEMAGRPFHPECFRCDACKRPIDKRYYSVDGRTICHDDYVVRHSREKKQIVVDKVTREIMVKLYIIPKNY